MSFMITFGFASTRYVRSPAGNVVVRFEAAREDRMFWADGAFGGSARGEVDPLERPIRPVEPCADRSPERFVQVGVGSAHPRSGPHVHPVEGRRIEVDTADHVAVDGIEHRVRESDTVTEILRVLLQIGQVLFQGHGSRPGIRVVVEGVGEPGLAWICSMLDIHAA